MRSHLLIAALACLLLSACGASTITGPTTIVVDGATIPLSVNDQKALSIAQNVENYIPVAQAGINSGLRLAFSLDPSLGTKFGAQMWAASNGVYSITLVASKLTTGTLPTPDDLKSAVAGFTSTATASQIGSVAAQIQNFQSFYTLIYQRIQGALASTTNAYVIGQLNKAGNDALLAIASAVQSATAQYAPTTTGA